MRDNEKVYVAMAGPNADLLDRQRIEAQHRGNFEARNHFISRVLRLRCNQAWETECGIV